MRFLTMQFNMNLFRVLILVIVGFSSTVNLKAQQCNFTSVNGGNSCGPQTFTLTATSMGTTSTTHQWTKVGGGSVSVTMHYPTQGFVYSQLVVYLSESTSYTVTSSCGGASTTVSVTITGSPISMTIDPPPTTPYCSGQNVTLTGHGGSSYTWYKDNIYQGSGTTFHPTETGTYHVSGSGSCGTQSTNGINLQFQAPPPPPQIVALESSKCQGTNYKTKFQIMGASSNYMMSVTGEGNYVSTNTQEVIWHPDFSGTATVSVTSFGCVTTTGSTSHTVYPKPALNLSPSEPLLACGVPNLTLAVESGHSSYTWYRDDERIPNQTTSSLLVNETGIYTIEAKESAHNCVGRKTVEVKRAYQADPSLICDDDLNWTENIALDETGKRIGNSRAYFNINGHPLQSQNKLFLPNNETKVFASEALRDRYNRTVGGTLPAPLVANDFSYKYAFVSNAVNGQPYTHLNFDGTQTTMNPDPVGTQPGTLGWYYSSANNIEPLTPQTQFPFSRSDFYKDGTGEPRKSGAPGEVLRHGSGRETVSGTFPVYTELDDYLLKRPLAIPGIVQDGSLFKEGVQTVVRDQNGRYAVSITDKGGNTLVTGRPGSSEDHTVGFTNALFLDPDNPSIFFYLFEPTEVTLVNNGNYLATDLINDVLKVGETFAGPDGKWPAGFYKVSVSGQIATVDISYQVFLKDVAYQFYDDVGRLVASVSPNGIKQLTLGISYDVIDKTTYKYNFRGWLMEMKEPDAGRTRYKYRKDGKIRYSQNAEQAAIESNDLHEQPKFSYTNYDQIGRPVESGAYTGEKLIYNFESFSNNLEADDQPEFGDEVKVDWVKTHYDYPDANFYAETGFPDPEVAGYSEYVQNFLRGAVSWSENSNMTTWYSYDEMGRVTWMVQKPKKMNQRVFVVKYSYDFLGNVLMVSNLAYSGGSLLSQFYHHYVYDANKRLDKAYTSLEPQGTKQLRATYEYYLHGPLKRIELGDNIQGIDFVYNINGWLTQINHPDKSQDPGGDSNDVFGMILDYYESDLNNLFAASPGQGAHDPARIHHLLPGMQNMIASHQPLIRFMPSVETYETPSFEKFSADNPMYNKMIADQIHKSANR
ncbi:MAG TPA: hypothetical protein VGK59_19325 [Ohtaekwangia sp.]